MCRQLTSSLHVSSFDCQILSIHDSLTLAPDLNVAAERVRPQMF
jgi:hypothetical protein